MSDGRGKKVDGKGGRWRTVRARRWTVRLVAQTKEFGTILSSPPTVMATTMADVKGKIDDLQGKDVDVKGTVGAPPQQPPHPAPADPAGAPLRCSPDRRPDPPVESRRREGVAKETAPRRRRRRRRSGYLAAPEGRHVQRSGYLATPMGRHVRRSGYLAAPMGRHVPRSDYLAAPEGRCVRRSGYLGAPMGRHLPKSGYLGAPEGHCAMRRGRLAVPVRSALQWLEQ
eukprot:248450-Prorocentrum_minimum.AAC.5